jgi:hypothetical protein
MFTQKPYAAFGYVLIKNTYIANEVVEVTVNDASISTFFWTKGGFKSINKATGEPMPDWVAGDFVKPDDYIKNDPYIKGTFLQTPIGETIVWCYDPKLNRQFEPFLSKFNLSDGITTSLPQGTKLFLCEGTLVIDGQEINSPTQVYLKNGDKEALAQGQCYGILFA